MNPLNDQIDYIQHLITVLRNEVRKLLESNEELKRAIADGEDDGDVYAKSLEENFHVIVRFNFLLF